MSFPAPYQINERREFAFKDNERYLAYLRPDSSNPVSAHSSAGRMRLSSHESLLDPQTPNERIYQAAAVHELFHGIQRAYPSYRSWADRADMKKLHGCDPGERANDWLTEGTASAVQIQYLERQNRQHLNHPSHGPSDIRWARTFDQPLHWPRLSEEQSVVMPAGVAPYAWQCSYGTWYFWYAVGNMLGSPNPLDTRRTGYLHHVFSQEGSWTDSGLAMVDLGLKHAAAAMDALRPYHGGLYALYPQFVAQYLDDDKFFEHVETVALETPAVYEFHSDDLSRIEPVATRAWRIRVQTAQDSASDAHYTVRFSLNSSDPAMKDALHLIVDQTLVSRPEDSATPYSQLRRIHPHLLDADGGIEYLVRVANVARNAVDTEPAEFTLKVEVEGFYGEDISSGLLPGAIPPGFAITGPDPKWSCFGDDDARAMYAFVTPEGVASQLERMLPQGFKNIEGDLDRAEMQAQKYSDAELQRIQKHRRRFETSFDASVDASDVERKVARAAAEIRLQTESQIMVKLSGRNAAGTCDVLLVLTVPGEPAPQRVPPDNYSVNITPQSGADAMATAADFASRLDSSAMQSMSVEQLQSLSEQFQTAMQDYDSTEPDWLRCTTNMRDCEDGEFHLGEASYQHLSGTFSFQVYKGDLELVAGTAEHPREYAEVSGHINITSTQEDVDNHLLDFLSRPGSRGDMLQSPGLEAFMQGGSMFGN
ncbi:hypothetical protein G5B41_07700 [bacterium SGD-2]|nr:hypothetical protein [bacterium SGD-2]